jgi:hypothetical protein
MEDGVYTGGSSEKKKDTSIRHKNTIYISAMFSGTGETDTVYQIENYPES